MLYRITTEYKSGTIERILDKLKHQFDGFSVIHQTGYWQGQVEQSVCFEIDTDVDVGIIRNLAQDIREINQQQCVLVQAKVYNRCLW